MRRATVHLDNLLGLAKIMRTTVDEFRTAVKLAAIRDTPPDSCILCNMDIATAPKPTGTIFPHCCDVCHSKVHDGLWVAVGLPDHISEELQNASYGAFEKYCALVGRDEV